MLKILRILAFNMLFLFSIPLYAENFIESPEIEQVFKMNKVIGTFVLYDVNNNTFYGYNKKRAQTLYPPASTFKIYNALIALSAGTVSSVDEVFFKYDGKSDYFLENWKKDSNLRYGIKVSHFPAFQELARRTGMKTMQENINKLNYGNKDLGKSVDNFWLTTLKITPIQQTTLLASLAKKELPFDKKYQSDVVDIIYMEDINGWKLYGKTGALSEKDENPALGWFVGFVEKDNNIYTFALNIDMPNETYISKRLPLAIMTIKAMGILK